MLPSLAPTGHKNGGDNERSFLVDKQAVDVGAVKGFYFFIFEPELVVVSNMKQGNGAEHGLLHLLPCWNEKNWSTKVVAVCARALSWVG